MKRNLVLALIALLAIGLFFVGCPTNGPEDPVPTTKPTPKPTPTVPGTNDLTPWAPEAINEPANYQALPKGVKDYDTPANNTGLLGWSGVFVTQGGQGSVTAGDEENTYKVSAMTNPGKFTVVFLQSNEFMFKKGYYLSLELPEDTKAKPIGMIAFPAYGQGENGADWSASVPVNMKNNAVDNKGVYLAGRVDFAWENNDNVWPRRTLCLYIYWHADEEAGEFYDFVVKKISHPKDEDLTEPPYPTTALTPPAVTEPTDGWKDFPVASITGATAVTFAGRADITVTKVGDDYSITIPTSAGGHTDITFPASEGSDFTDGYYLSLVLPGPNAANKLIPMRVISVPNDFWTGAVDIDGSNAGKYVTGNVGMLWEKQEEHDFTLNRITLQFYWHPGEVAGNYTFTLKKIKITDDEIAPPLDEWTPYTPPAKDVPSDWIDYKFKTTEVTFAPSGGTITKNTDGSYTVKGKTNPVTADNEWAHTEVVFKGDDFAFKGGYYLSLTLPAQNAESTMKPARIYTTAKNGSTTNYNSAVDYDKRNTLYWIEGKVDCMYSHEAFNRHDAIILSIYWHDDVVAGQDYEFTITSFKVKEEDDGSAPPPETPTIHDTSELDDATYELNATTVKPLKVVPTWTDNSSTYTYEWWQDTSTDQSTWPATNLNVSTATFTPPVDEEGIFYYYCVVKYPDGGTQALTRVIKIIGGYPPDVPPPPKRRLFMTVPNLLTQRMP
jgi:hypothetical protein